MKKYKVRVPDRELACVPADTPEAQNYLQQMACAANFGFTNRQLITHWLREALRCCRGAYTFFFLPAIGHL